MSLILLHWAVIMGRVSTEPRKNMPLRSIGYAYNQSEQRSMTMNVDHRGQLINFTFTGSRRKDVKNIFSIDKCLDGVSLFIFQHECAVDVFLYRLQSTH